MADLSPNARAVLYAANRASSYGPDDCLNDSRFIAAAALRAAADQVEQKWQGFAHEACQEIRAIADELDNNSTHK
jgi:hypothetical protein